MTGITYFCISLFDDGGLKKEAIGKISLQLVAGYSSTREMTHVRKKGDFIKKRISQGSWSRQYRIVIRTLKCFGTGTFKRFHHEF